MSRAIDDDALKLDIVEEGQKSKRYKLGEVWELNRDEIWNVIDRQPTIEARKKGRWMPQDMNKSNGMVSTAVYYYPKCSVCGWNSNYTNFCPNCGSDMRGEQE